MSEHSAVTTIAPVVVVEPFGSGTAGWRDLWQYRELLYFLVWRDLKVRYKQTILGAGWALIQPFATMVVFSLFFGTLASMPSDGVPYPVFSYAGLVPWTYFATAVSAGAASLVGNQNLISKVYFPRLLVPLAAVSTPLVDAAIALAFVGVIMLWFGVAPSGAIVALPLFALLAVATALGAALWFAALNVEFRDVRYVLPFVIQFGLFVTPVAYPSSLVPDEWRTLYSLNPMATVVEGFRWSLAGTPAPSAAMVAASVASAAATIATGYWHFTRTERTFADLI
jgi:lipopolysaccharide transport system permease protein